MKQEKGEMVDCFLTSNRQELIRAIRPFRAIHHQREATIFRFARVGFLKFLIPG
ncbi:MAG: hypothetical protein WBI18_10010 [Candidatus Saccharicenans sp.]